MLARYCVLISGTTIITRASLWCTRASAGVAPACESCCTAGRIMHSLNVSPVICRNIIFLAVLQVHNDAQVAFHSHYEDVRDFIREVIESFATHAPAESLLVLKHHPMDRGARHYGRLIDSLCARYNIADRIAYVHQIHLPTALDHARGVVAINSTVGLSALLHKAPVKVMGDAIYDMAGLTCQASLEKKFWVAPGKVSKPLFDAFHRHVIATTQINGSFHGLEPFFSCQPAFSPSRQKKVSSRTMQ
ncbi:hypothetical protein ACFS07_07390 [Undibacterium arcticum]